MTQTQRIGRSTPRSNFTITKGYVRSVHHNSPRLDLGSLLLALCIFAAAPSSPVDYVPYYFRRKKKENPTLLKPHSLPPSLQNYMNITQLDRSTRRSIIICVAIQGR